MPQAAFITALLSAAFMTGVIWFVQLSHYPLFASIPSESFTAYESRNTRLTSMVVVPVMLLEIASTGVLLWYQPDWLPQWTLWAGAALLGIAMLSTVTLQEPIHAKLTKAHDPNLIRKLVATNWIRTAAWTARLGVLAYSLWVVLNAGTGVA